MKGNSSLFGSCPMRRAASGDLSFMGNGKKAVFARNASRRKDIDSNGLLDVVAHGSEYIIELENGSKTIRISPREAAKVIRKAPLFRKSKGVRLISCSTGANPDGFAQHLANALGKPVYAPTKKVWALPDGQLYVSSDRYNHDKGEFRKYVPGGIKYGKH